MKNLRRVFAVLVVVTMLVTAMIPASAATSPYSYSAEAQKLYDLGLYKGVSTTTFDPDLGSQLTREQGVAMLLRLLGKEPAALALTDNDVNLMLMIFSDKDKIQPWAKKYVAYGIMYKMINGYPDGTFRPQGELLGKEFCKMLLAALGYTVDGPIFDNAAFYLSQYSKLSYNLAAKINDKAMIRDDLVGVAYAALNAKYKSDGKTVIKKLVESNVITEAQAIASGAYNDDLYAMADAAVKAYEAIVPANLATVADCDATSAVKAKASDAVAKVQVTSDKTALQKRIDTQASAIAARRAAIQASIDADTKAKAAAESAVAAYENATIAVATSAADIVNADSLKKAAEDKVNLVNDVAARTAFFARISAQKAKLDARIADVNNIIAATTAVNNYIAAPYNTLDLIAAAEKLEADASAKVAIIVDAAAKADLSKKIADQKALVAAKKIELSSATVAVKAENLKTLTVTFSKEMDESTISANNTVKVENNGASITVDTKLLSDKKTLIIEYAAAVGQNATIKLTLDGLKDTKGVALTKFEQTYTLKDIVDPVVTAVTVLAPNKIKIIASEPIDVTTNGGYALMDGTTGPKVLDGTTPVFAKATPNNKENSVTLELGSPLAVGSHTITVSGVKDYAGWIAAANSFSGISIQADTAAPTAVTVEMIGPAKVKVTFNENITNIAGPQFKYSQVGGSEVSPTNVTISGNTAILDVPAFDLVTGLRNSFGYYVKYAYVADEAGNYNPVMQSVNGVANYDTVKPGIVSITPEKDNTLKVVFNEKVQKSTIACALQNSSGSTIEGSAASIDDYNRSNPDGMTYKVKFNTLSNGTDALTYKVKVSGAKDVTVIENQMDSVTQSFVAFDTKAPSISKTLYSVSGNTAKVEIYYSESVDSSVAGSMNNYYMETNENGILKYYPLSTVSGAQLAVNSGNKVTITVPVNASNSYNFYVSAKDLAGNTANGLLASALPRETTASAMAVDTLSVTGTNKITLVVKNDTFSAINKDSFRFLVDGQPYNLGIVSVVLASDMKTVDIYVSGTISPDVKSYTPVNGSAYAFNTLAMYIGDNNLKDSYGMPFTIAQNSAVAVADKVAPAQLPVYSSDKAYVNGVSGSITLRFTEAVQSVDGDASHIAGGLTVTAGSVTLRPYVDYTTAMGADGKSVVVTLTTTGAAAAKGKVSSDLSNFEAKITNPSYIVDYSNADRTKCNVVIPR